MEGVFWPVAMVCGLMPSLHFPDYAPPQGSPRISLNRPALATPPQSLPVIVTPGPGTPSDGWLKRHLNAKFHRPTDPVKTTAMGLVAHIVDYSHFRPE